MSFVANIVAASVEGRNSFGDGVSGGISADMDGAGDVGGRVCAGRRVAGKGGAGNVPRPGVFAVAVRGSAIADVGDNRPSPAGIALRRRHPELGHGRLLNSRQRSQLRHSPTAAAELAAGSLLLPRSS